VTDDLFHEPDDATQLAPQERDGLLQTWLNSRGDLNRAEEQNILDGAAWARRRRIDAVDLLTEEFSKSLHKQMFGDVWSWAGTYRQRPSNIGIEPHQIVTDVPVLFDEARYWLKHKSYSWDELAIRIHHRLVAIHPFPNGNGRHTRLIADLIAEKLDQKSFTWGGGVLQNIGELRTQYIAALRAADDHDIGPLMAFARS
jgi:Fic-DOC domain mobile mystery protein B